MQRQDCSACRLHPSFTMFEPTKMTLKRPFTKAASSAFEYQGNVSQRFLTRAEDPPALLGRQQLFDEPKYAVSQVLTRGNRASDGAEAGSPQNHYGPERTS